MAYPTTSVEPVFWRPLAGLAGDSPIRFVARLATINVGWLLLYLLVYFPTLVLVRTILKVA